MRSAIDEFNGRRLQKALDSKMLSVQELSGLTDISTSMLYYLINNEKKPSHKNLNIIANTLNLPETFFFKDEPDKVAHSFFRSYKRSTKVLRLSIRTKLDLVSEIRDYLSSYVKFPVLNLPNFEELEDRDPRTISSQEVEDFALRTRSFWGLSDGVITNTTLLLENNGIFLTRFLLGSQDIDALSRIDIDTKSVLILLSSDKNSNSRAKFDNIHELGHSVLHSRINPKYFDFEKKQNHNLLEEQANRFASSFLLPEISFTRDFSYPTLESFKALKTKWKVSIGLLIYRSRQLGLINDRTFKNLQINVSRRGWRKSEPLENIIQEETPSLARQAFELVFDEKLLLVSKMENDLGLHQDEIEKICGLEKGFFNKYKTDSDRPKLRLVK